MKWDELDLKGYETLFLDRDGVINRLRPNDYVKCREEFEFLPDILEALAKWNKKFKHIFIVTNQRGVGKGIMSESDLLDVHSMMLSEIKRHGGRIDKIYCCTAVSDSNINRKPNLGMALQAKKEYPEIDLAKAVMLGDSESDRKFAKNAGMQGVVIYSER
jgi:histidinol-phosphate phosphatase family protein